MTLSMSIGIGMDVPFDVDVDRFNDDFNFERSDDDELLSHADKSADFAMYLLCFLMLFHPGDPVNTVE